MNSAMSVIGSGASAIGRTTADFFQNATDKHS